MKLGIRLVGLPSNWELTVALREKTKMKFQQNLLAVVCLMQAVAFAGRAACADDTVFVFQSNRYGNLDIFQGTVEGSSFRRLTTSADDEWNPKLGPKGQKLAFVTGTGINSEIWVMDMMSRIKTRITENNVPDICPAWSPDGKKLAWSEKKRQKSGDRWALMTANADGTEKKELTSYGNDLTPCWSPDGSKIVVSRNFGLVILDAETGRVNRVLTTASGILGDMMPVYSPNGSNILFMSNRDASKTGNRLYMISLRDKKVTVREIDTDGPAIQGCYTPDGKKVLFAHGSESELRIGLKDLDTGSEVDLTSVGFASESMPSTILQYIAR